MKRRASIAAATILTALAGIGLPATVSFAQQSGGVDQMRVAAERAEAERAASRVASMYREGIEAREGLRNSELEEAWAELDEHLLAANEAEQAGEIRKRDAELSESLRLVVEIDVLLGDDRRTELEADERYYTLVDRASDAARNAENRGDWILSNELFVRLSALYEGERRFDDEVDRLNARLAMVRLYAPERLWELNNERRVLGGDGELPAYNPFGDTYQEKLEPIRSDMIMRALQNAAYRHIDNGDMRGMLTSGIESLETFATTRDLQRVFTGMGDDRKLEGFLSGLRDMRGVLEDKRHATTAELGWAVESILRLNSDTINVPPQALLHEFGNGSLDELDRYTAVIWPDEIKRFERSTQGKFTGVGIQIEKDELFNVKVVTPLPGSPAQVAGIGAGDIITSVNGRSIVGFTLDQAVQVITGPEGTSVELGIERGDGDEKEGLAFDLKRTSIDLPTVKGWRKTGPEDDAWDWFVDREAGIGYLRLTSFSENTTRDFDRAIAKMRRAGLNGLVLDLRFNPGGLLDQAVSISNRWVDRGLIVKTEGAGGVVTQREFARRVPSSKSLQGVPTAVLINNGSASASEIVSGAIQAFAREGNIDAWLIGENTYGKGSVQNVFPLDPRGRAMMKLTTHYYKLRDDRLIHRKPGAERWGIAPDISVEMLPEQIVESLTIRRDADIFEIDKTGNVVENAERPDVQKLIDDGIDLQLQRALLTLHEARAGTMAAADQP
ncbi:MAG: S41 family peptidase [Planctomycetota bacterium]